MMPWVVARPLSQHGLAASRLGNHLANAGAAAAAAAVTTGTHGSCQFISMRIRHRGFATMKAALYHQFRGPIAVEEVIKPKAPPGGVVVEVRANGVCRSDWHGWCGHDGDIQSLPHVPGHELAGVITEIGPGVHKFSVGDRVVSPFILSCGTCAECSVLHQPTVCSKQQQPGFHLWGSFAEFVALPRADLNLMHLPADVDFESAASLGCRFTTAFRAVVTRGNVKKGSTVAVLGCGGVGLSAIAIAKALGARVVAADVNLKARDAATALGADVVLDAGLDDADLREALRESTKGGADVSVEAAGAASSVVNSVYALRRGGRMVQVALPLGRHAGPPVPMALAAAWELELVGSHGAEAADLPKVLGMVREGRLRPGDLVVEKVCLSAACNHLMAMDAEKESAGGMRVINDFQH